MGVDASRKRFANENGDWIQNRGYERIAHGRIAFKCRNNHVFHIAKQDQSLSQDPPAETSHSFPENGNTPLRSSEITCATLLLYRRVKSSARTTVLASILLRLSSERASLLAPFTTIFQGYQQQGHATDAKKHTCSRPHFQSSTAATIAGMVCGYLAHCSKKAETIRSARSP